MIWYKFVIWALICMALGEILNWVISPIDPVYSALLYIFPFVIFGFQEKPFCQKTTRSIIGMPLYNERINYKRLTFWGIPVGSMKEISSFGLTRPFHRNFESKSSSVMPVILTKLLYKL